VRRTSAKNVFNPLKSSWEAKMQNKADLAALREQEAAVKKGIQEQKNVCCGTIYPFGVCAFIPFISFLL
jgi:hypothetical protein